MIVNINEETLQDVINIETGLFSPLNGFMGEEDFRSVVNCCHLADGQVFPLPITLDVPAEQFEQIRLGGNLTLEYLGKPVAELDVKSKFRMTEEDIRAVFHTLENAHPGVRKEQERSACRVGGALRLTDRTLLNNALKPEETKQILRKRAGKPWLAFRPATLFTEPMSTSSVLGWRCVTDYLSIRLSDGKDRRFYAGSGDGSLSPHD